VGSLGLLSFGVLGPRFVCGRALISLIAFSCVVVEGGSIDLSLLKKLFEAEDVELSTDSEMDVEMNQ